MSFVELRTLGFNAQTAGFFGTLLFTTLSFLAQYAQLRTLYRKRSGQSLATSFFIYCAGMYVVGLFYGLEKQRLALIYNGGLLVTVYTLIVVGLFRFKGFSLIDWGTLVVCATGLATMATTDDTTVKQTVFALSLFGLVIWCAMPPLELWRAKKPGSMRIEPLIVSASSTSFWILYGLATGDLVLSLICPVILTMVVCTIVLWVHYGGNIRSCVLHRFA